MHPSTAGSSMETFLLCIIAAILSLAVHSGVDVIARGAAIAAGLGANVWNDIHCVPPLPKGTIYEPNIRPDGM